MREGYTLVELLIVCAIAGIIIAIVHGGCHPAKDNPEYQAECANYCRNTKYKITTGSTSEYSYDIRCQCIDIDRETLYLD